MGFGAAPPDMNALARLMQTKKTENVHQPSGAFGENTFLKSMAARHGGGGDKPQPPLADQNRQSGGLARMMRAKVGG